jgi:hypothetical protein
MKNNFNSRSSFSARFARRMTDYYSIPVFVFLANENAIRFSLLFPEVRGSRQFIRSLALVHRFTIASLSSQSNRKSCLACIT